MNEMHLVGIWQQKKVRRTNVYSLIESQTTFPTRFFSVFALVQRIAMQSVPNQYIEHSTRVL